MRLTGPTPVAGQCPQSLQRDFSLNHPMRGRPMLSMNTCASRSVAPNNSRAMALASVTRVALN